MILSISTIIYIIINIDPFFNGSYSQIRTLIVCVQIHEVQCLGPIVLCGHLLQLVKMMQTILVNDLIHIVSIGFCFILVMLRMLDIRSLTDHVLILRQKSTHTFSSFPMEKKRMGKECGFSIVPLPLIVRNVECTRK